MSEALELIKTCRRMLLERGNVENVRKLLAQHRLSELHHEMWNPFFMLPHTDFECFPQDHLHGMYVVFFWCYHFCGFLFFAPIDRCAWRSDLGVCEVVERSIRMWILRSHRFETTARAQQHVLSMRVQRLTALLPRAVRTYGFFLDKGPPLTGGHFRHAPCMTQYFVSLRV